MTYYTEELNKSPTFAYQMFCGTDVFANQFLMSYITNKFCQNAVILATPGKILYFLK